MKELFTLGELYISDFIAKDAQPQTNKVEMKLMLTDSGAVRLEKSAPLDAMYGKYWYRSGINATMKNELKSIVDSICSISKLENDDLWIDIASNDGTLLSFVPKSLFKMGIDPADDTFKEEAKTHADIIIQDFFSAEVFKKSWFGELKAKVVTSIAMFYDLENPDKFIQDVAEVLDDEGVWVLQMSYTPLMLQQIAFDNLVHEHLYYYSLFNIKTLLEKNGFKIMDCQLNDINGGSFRVYAMKQTATSKNFSSQPYRDVCNFRVNSILEYEKTLKLDCEETWKDFFNKINDLKEKTVSFIKQEKAKGKTIWGYGACHDKETRLVTESGIKNIEDVSLEDKVYTINTITNEIELSSIDEIMHFPYEGELIQFYGKRINQSVTPNHQILFQTEHNYSLRFESAEEIAKRQRFLMPRGNWIGTNDDDTINILKFADQSLYSNKCRKIQDVFQTSDFLYLLGIFIGDGYACNQTGGFSINLCVPKEDKARNKLVSTLKRMNLSFRDYDNEVQVASQALYNIALGCEKGALNKRIPKWALEYTPKYLQHLLDGLVDSDGWYENDRKKFCTSSFNLVKDTVELCIKLGYHPSITKRKKNSAKINGTRIIKSSQGYIVNIATTQPSCYNNKKVNYNGNVWCLSVKNKNFLIERKGKISFSGNSTKGNTLLQYFGLDNTLIDGIAERSPAKFGLKTIGTNIPICSEEEMRKAKPDYLLVLPWHFINEFITREADFLKNGGKFIVPCPKFVII